MIKKLIYLIAILGVILSAYVISNFMNSTVNDHETSFLTIAQFKDYVYDKGIDDVSFEDFKHLAGTKQGTYVYAIEYQLKDGSVLVSANTQDSKPFSIHIIDNNENEESLKNTNIPIDNDKKED